MRNVAIAAKDLANVETIVIVDLSANVARNSCLTEPVNVMKYANVDQVASALAHAVPKISKSFAPKRLTRKIWFSRDFVNVDQNAGVVLNADVALIANAPKK